MSSVHRVAGSKYWHAFFTLPDGRRVHRSTGTTNRTKARRIADTYADAAAKGRANLLTETRVRDVLASIHDMVNEDGMKMPTVKTYLKGWLERKEAEVAEDTLPAYKSTAEALLSILSSKMSMPMDAVTRADAVRFRDTLGRRLASATANKYLKIARVIWNDARKDGTVRDNPFALTPILKTRDAGTRRPFTPNELRTLLAVCDEPWRGMVLLGLYTGQRLRDLANLTWSAVDLQRGEINFTTRKTGRDAHLPIAQPLMNYLLAKPSADDPSTPLFPDLFDQTSGTLSNRFAVLLAKAGLAQARPHRSRDIGRAEKRQVSSLSFHCLRHTATSLLKNAGVSDVVAREIIGHDSEAVSRRYTHIETETLRSAVNNMPDVTKPADQ